MMLLVSSTYAENNKEPLFKVITEVSGNDLKVKALAVNQRKINNKARLERAEPTYITSFIASVDGKVVYEVFVAPSVSKNPLFKFKIKDGTKNKLLNFKLINNKNQRENQTFKINKLDRKSFPISNIKIDHIDDESKMIKVFEKSSLEEVIKYLYGTTESILGDINLDIMNDNIINGKFIIYFKSSIDFESIGVFTDNSSRAAIAYFKVPKNEIIDYAIGVDHKWNECHIKVPIIIVGKSRDGKLHKAIKEVNYIGCSTEETLK